MVGMSSRAYPVGCPSTGSSYNTHSTVATGITSGGRLERRRGSTEQRDRERTTVPVCASNRFGDPPDSRDESAHAIAWATVFLRQLEYLTALARERHFGRAATACRVSQPAL